MSKKVAVFFKESGRDSYPFTKEEYFLSYQELDQEIQSRGGEFFIVRDNKSYLGNGKFSQSWQFKDGALIDTNEVSVEAIYDKGEFASDDTVPVLNAPCINEICTNKWKTYELFSEYCPKTLRVESEDDYIQALSEISGEKKVIKPIDDEEGNGVFIGDDDFLVKAPRHYPLLVQEFLDTSSGIPGIYKGIHDLRVVVISGEIQYSFFRTPPEGSLLANVAQGGSLQLIPHEKIPKEVEKLVMHVDEKVSPNGDYVFGVDVGFVNGVPKIIELNSRVSLFASERGPEFKHFMERIAEILLK